MHNNWKSDEARLSKLIFIGKDIDSQKISQSFKKEVGVTIKLEEELTGGGPSILGWFLVIVFVVLLLYPGNLGGSNAIQFFFFLFLFFGFRLFQILKKKKKILQLLQTLELFLLLQ